MRIRLSIQAAGQAEINALLELYVRLNLAYLRAHPRTPSLYRSGVRYRREARGREEWDTIPYALTAGHEDCEGLAAWRAAELRLRGEHARAVVRRVRPGLWHCLVQRADGTIEDPSAKLGMRGDG